VAPYYTFQKDLRPFGGGTPFDYAVSTTLNIDMGEFVGWDATNKTLVSFVRDGSAGKFAGIARGSQAQIKGLGNQAALLLSKISVFTTGVHALLGTAAEVYGHGDAVYMNGTDVTKVTKTAGTGGVQVGIVHLPDGTTRTGAVRVPVLIDEYTITQA
jgi:hypothetical protein